MTRSANTLELSFASLEFHDSIVISTIKEDQLFDKEQVEELRLIFDHYFGDNKFVYISNRKFKYNVNPVIYLDLIQKNTLAGMAVVVNEHKGIKTANFEKQFATMPFEIFQTQEEALTWAKRLLQEKK